MEGTDGIRGGERVGVVILGSIDVDQVAAVCDGIFDGGGSGYKNVDVGADFFGEGAGLAVVDAGAGYVKVHAGLAGGLAKGFWFHFVQVLFGGKGSVQELIEVIVRWVFYCRVEVDGEVVGAAGIRGSGIPRVDVDTAQVDHP